MTYIFKDGEPYMTKTSDRYLGAIELGLEKVGIGTVSPSHYSELYINNVEERLLSMLKGLGIKNGPVFMQGFVDGDTVRFYDPGYRFPGSEYDTMFEKIWNIDIMKMMVNFAITGKMSDDYGSLTKELAFLKGNSVITLFPVIRAGKIKAIKGIDEIKNMPEVICYTIRHEVGEKVPFSKDVNQRIAEIDIIADDVDHLKETVGKVLRTLQIIDENGENMMFGNLNIEEIY